MVIVYLQLRGKGFIMFFIVWCVSQTDVVCRYLKNVYLYSFNRFILKKKLYNNVNMLPESFVKINKPYFENTFNSYSNFIEINFFRTESKGVVANCHETRGKCSRMRYFNCHLDAM